MSPLFTIEEPAARRTPPGWALWALGFRPFYLLASGFAALSVPLWTLQFLGLLPHAYLQGPVWHGHEMLFGFALAVIVGFLFTAGRNWSGEPTPSGRTLMALAALWVAGRVLVVTPYGWAAAAAVVAFPLAAAVGLAIPFVRSGNRRNYFFVGLLVALAGAAAVVHLQQLGVTRIPAMGGLQVGLDIVLFILAVMGGRVIPMFTNNGVPGAQARKRPWLERAALGSVLALIAADAVGLHGALLAALCVVAALAHGARWLLWQPWKTLRTPLVWVLHVAYLWVVLHLLLRAGGALALLAPSVATHALTAGALSGLVIGMMTRTARGHTGRPLRADRCDVACYALVLLAGALRVGVPLLVPQLTTWALGLSATAWALGFGLYAVHYAPFLARPRLDGKPG